MTDTTQRHDTDRWSARRRRRTALLSGTLLAMLCVGGAILRGIVVDPSIPVRLAARAGLLRLGGVFLGTEGVVLQEGFHDCGPASLANLLGLLGRSSPALDSLAHLAGTTPAGTTAAGLVAAARSLGLDLRLELRPATDVGRLDPPYIAWVGEDHFVTVASRRSLAELVVLDPRLGAVRLPAPSLERLWSGAVLRPLPGPNRRAAR